MSANSNRPLVVFNILVTYILIQFIWWAYLIAGLIKQVYGNTDKYHAKLWMVFGEGLVFSSLLIVGIYITRRAFIRQQEFNRQQKNFLLSVTHELKTPIAATKLTLQTLEKRELPAETQKDLLSRAITETNRLNHLVENILVSARIDSAEFSINKEYIDISGLSIQTLQTLKETIGKKHQTLLEIEPGIKINADPNYFPSVLNNLFENAVKYSPEGSTVTITLKKSTNGVRINVVDEGVGIPEEVQKKIFDKFFRVGNEQTRSAKGTGLGLYIVKEIVEKHGGEVSLKKNSFNGSNFEVFLPA